MEPSVSTTSYQRDFFASNTQSFPQSSPNSAAKNISTNTQEEKNTEQSYESWRRSKGTVYRFEKS